MRCLPGAGRVGGAVSVRLAVALTSTLREGAPRVRTAPRSDGLPRPRFSRLASSDLCFAVLEATIGQSEAVRTVER